MWKESLPFSIPICYDIQAEALPLHPSQEVWCAAAASILQCQWIKKHPSGLYMFWTLWMLSGAAALLCQNLPNYLLTWMAVMDSLCVCVCGGGTMDSVPLSKEFGGGPRSWCVDLLQWWTVWGWGRGCLASFSLVSEGMKVMGSVSDG